MTDVTEVGGPFLMERGSLGIACWSEDRKHRYFLVREFEDDGPTMAICMQNPSKASADESDPTVTRVIGFAKREKMARLIVLNMGAGVATDPKDFLRMKDPVGPANLEFLKTPTMKPNGPKDWSPLGFRVDSGDILVGAWGNLSKRHQRLFGPSLEIVKKWPRLKCFGKTKSGDARHPLYLPANARLIDY